MFIDFEGIDGSGKTTLSNRVADRLRALGYPVCHSREGGALCSPIAERIRALTRDVHHVALSETAELLLYAAREAQTVEEGLRPAIERGEWVVTDQYVYSHLALARDGRGLDHPSLWQVLELAAGKLLPDLVVFVDVEPAIARARNCSRRIRDGRMGDCSRKNQAGAGLPCRVRRGFHRLAQADPERWVVFDNTWASLDEAEEAIVRVILARAEGKPLPALPRSRGPAGLPGPAEAPGDEYAVRASLLAAVDAIAVREPPLAAHLLCGLSGFDVDERRLRLALLAPAVVAHGLHGLSDQGASALRHALKAGAPGEVARGLFGLWDEESLGLRLELAPRAPAEVARSLEGVAAPAAMKLRERLAEIAPGDVLMGLAGVDTVAAWDLRRQLGPRAPADALAYSVKLLDTDAAWAVREDLVTGFPLAVIESLAGLVCPRAYALRARFMRRAPRAVVETLLGLDDDAAWKLRETIGDRMREAAESAAGLASERAWTLRERLAAAWPAAVVCSLRGVARTPRGHELLFRVLDRASGDLEVLREATWVLDPAATAHSGTSPAAPLSQAV